MALDTRYSRPGPDGGEALDTVVVADGSHAFDSMRAPDATQEDASVVMDAERSDGANAESDVVSTLDGANQTDASAVSDGALMDRPTPSDSMMAVDARSDTGIQVDVAVDVPMDRGELMLHDTGVPLDTGNDVSRPFCLGGTLCGDNCCSPLEECIRNTCQPRVRIDAAIDPSG